VRAVVEDGYSRKAEGYSRGQMLQLVRAEKSWISRTQTGTAASRRLQQGQMFKAEIDSYCYRQCCTVDLDPVGSADKLFCFEKEIENLLIWNL